MLGTNWDYDSNARGRFDALIVGLDCDLGNPSLISRGIVGG